MTDKKSPTFSRKNFLKTGSFGMAGLITAAFKDQSQKDYGRKDFDADVIVYGGTSAAVIAAVQVARMNKSVIMVSPDKHLGGLTSSGLGFTDTGNKAVIGGLAREFYHRVYMHYQNNDAWKWQDRSEYGNRGQGTPAADGNNRTMWIFEPHVAESVYEDFVDEYNIKVLRDEWLDRDEGVQVENGRITFFKTLSGKTFKAKAFIDATYEGDLMAATGVTYTVGREANSVYGEKWNGVQTGVFQHNHYFPSGKNAVDPYFAPGVAGSGQIPLVSANPPGKKRSGDKKVQAYCYRMCLTDHPRNKTPFPMPDTYDTNRYLALLRLLETGWHKRNNFFTKYDAIPNRKTDTNNHGPFSTDNIGMSYDYPEASYEKRKVIIKQHQAYQKGLMYFLSNDPRVPAEIQEEADRWGLAKDEFTDNDNWPYQLYIREARRMIGEHVITEHDIMGNKKISKPVGMGSYTMDSHNVQRYITTDGHIQNEGDIGVSPPGPYKIAYGSLLPKKQECENLLVPMAVSTSHIAFGSIRMEPVFMILGQSAATATVLAAEHNQPAQDLDYETLKKQLQKDAQILTL